MAEEVKISQKAKKKSKNFFLKLLFSHTMINILLLVLQIVVLFVTFHLMGQYWQGFLVGCIVLSVILIIYIINDNENPAFKLAWMIPICAVPIFGVAAYIVVKTNPGTWKLKERLDGLKKETEKYLQPVPEVVEQMEKEKSPISDLSHYLQNINQMPTYQNTRVTYFSLGEDKYADILEELKKAEKFIFLEYYIIDRGKMWDSVLEILEQKVKEGVEVRVMYDGMCTLYKLPYRYPRQLTAKGIKAQVFFPIVPLLSTHQNSRDHRKILVIDGKIAYNGGINLADEYINEINLYGHWKDAAVKLEGEAVKSFTVMFLQMWNVSSTLSEDYERYINVKPQSFTDAPLGYVIPYNDDPINREDIAECVYLDIIAKAKNYVHIMTPYLILDYETENALMFAAKRGVDVKLILPHIPDKKIPFAIARTYYRDLLQAGVKIYEYEPGFVHAKVFVSDDDRAVVGSINLDYRSLFEHFECATFIYNNPVVADIEKDVQKTLEKCITVTEEYYRSLPLFGKLVGRVFRIFGSLM